jgi:ribosome-associated protein
MITVTPEISIEENEIVLEFVRASGQLRYDVKNSPALPDAVRARLMRLAGSRLTAEGVLVIIAQQYRTQPQNRQDALDQLIALVRRAAIPPKVHIPTKPTRASKVRRLDSKRRHGEIKRQRRSAVEY